MLVKRHANTKAWLVRGQLARYGNESPLLRTTLGHLANELLACAEECSGQGQFAPLAGRVYEAAAQLARRPGQADLVAGAVARLALQEGFAQSARDCAAVLVKRCQLARAWSAPSSFQTLAQLVEQLGLQAKPTRGNSARRALEDLVYDELSAALERMAVELVSQLWLACLTQVPSAEPALAA